MSRPPYSLSRPAVRLSLAAGLILVAVLMLSGCRGEPSLVGRWRDQSPASLLYEFREDGSVGLVQGESSVPVFRDVVKEEGVLELHDGMGRQRTLRFELVNDQLLLRELADPDVIFAEFRREL